MKPPYILVPDKLSNDTKECLKTLHEAAEKGELIGVAFVAMLKRRGYIANSAGEAYRNPTFTRGMVAALDDKLSERIRGGNP